LRCLHDDPASRPSSRGRDQEEREQQQPRRRALWRRQTHKFYPPEVRARVGELMRVAQAIKRGKAAYEADGVFVAFASPAAVADVFESCVIPHDIASEMW
jgi:hypothetical protein